MKLFLDLRAWNGAMADNIFHFLAALNSYFSFHFINQCVSFISILGWLLAKTFNYLAKFCSPHIHFFGDHLEILDVIWLSRFIHFLYKTLKFRNCLGYSLRKHLSPLMWLNLGFQNIRLSLVSAYIDGFFSQPYAILSVDLHIFYLAFVHGFQYFLSFQLSLLLNFFGLPSKILGLIFKVIIYLFEIGLLLGLFGFFNHHLSEFIHTVVL